MVYKSALVCLGIVGYSIWIPLGWTLDLKDLPGEWQGSNGATYQINVNGNQVTVQSPDSKDFFSKRPFRGAFLPKTFKLNYQATIQDFNNAFPMSVRQQAVQKKYQYRGEMNIVSDTELRLKYITDYFNWDGNKQLTRIDPDYKVDTITLKKAPSYKIGSIRLDDQELQRRIRLKVLELEAEIRTAQQERLPTLKAELQALQQDYAKETKRVDGYADQVRRLDQETQQIKNQLAQLATTLQQSPNWNKRLELERAIRQLEERIAESHQAGRLEEVANLFNRVDEQNAALKKLEATLEDELKTQKQIDGLLREMNAKIADRKVIEEALVVSNSTGPALLSLQQSIADRLVNKANEIQQQEQQIRYQEMQIAYYQRKPLVTRVTLFAANQPKYEASMDKDETLLKQWADDIQYIDSQLQQTSTDLKQINEALAEADQHRQKLRSEVLESSVHTKKTGDELAALIWTNAQWRYGVELAGNSFDVVLSTIQGGPVGAYTELAQKTVEHFALDQLAFKSFDESALKAKIYAEQRELAPESELMDFAGSQLKKAPLSALKQSALDALERETLKTARSQAAGNAIKAAYSDSGLSSASKRLSETRDTLSNNEKVYKNALQTLDKNLPDARRALVDSQRLNREAMRKFVTAERAEMLRLDEIKKAETVMKDAEKKLQKLKSGTLTSLGKSIGVGLLVDGLKSYLQSRFNHQEEEAWLRYFKADIQLQTVIQYFQKASNHYWNTMDTQIKLQEHHESLAYLREHLEKERQEYLASIQKNGNFYIAKNNAFTDKENPIKVELSLSNPAFQEAIFLKGIKQPPLEGQPLSLVNPGNSLPVNSATLNTGHHQFQFSAGQLKSLQDSGDLSLEIYQK